MQRLQIDGAPFDHYDPRTLVKLYKHTLGGRVLGVHVFFWLYRGAIYCTYLDQICLQKNKLD